MQNIELEGVVRLLWHLDSDIGNITTAQYTFLRSLESIASVTLESNTARVLSKTLHTTIVATRPATRHPPDAVQGLCAVRTRAGTAALRGDAPMAGSWATQKKFECCTR